jgi:small neutral amino acid transporter SnatA (MarC family)
MRQGHGSDAVGTDGRLGGETIAFITSLAAVAATVYVVFATATGADVVPRSTHDLRVLGSLSLALAGFAVVMATRDELRARRRGMSETPESLPGASPTLAASRR